MEFLRSCLMEFLKRSCPIEFLEKCERYVNGHISICQYLTQEKNQCAFLLTRPIFLYSFSSRYIREFILHLTSDFL